jgi:U3 small nucleolar ribonucleoprotein protein LCP5
MKMTETLSKQPPSSPPKIDSLLESLRSCLSNAQASLPKPIKSSPLDVTIEPPQNGISLLDIKNDLLLSYLHNLVFLILHHLRQRSLSKARGDFSELLDSEADDYALLHHDIVQKLVQLRVYLDRGVRPLETRLKYQIEKVIKAAEDSERAQRRTHASSTGNDKKSQAPFDGSNSSEDGNLANDDEMSENGGDSGDEAEEEIDEMTYRPNISAFSRAIGSDQKQKPFSSKSANDGIYRPPRIKPTALPTEDRGANREARRPKKSTVIDEFVRSEMSSAPLAEPSIGSTIQRGGRRVITQQERERETERKEYEEMNFVRLPKESKKERAKRRTREGRDTGFGGGELRLLMEGADRIGKLTRRAKSSGGVLERSRKRRLPEAAGDSSSVGQAFEKRRKKIESWRR